MQRTDVRTATRGRRSDEGNALVIALFLFLVAAGLYVTMHSAVQRETSGVELEVERTQAFTAADGLAQVGEQRLIDSLAQYIPLSADTTDDPFLVLEGSESWPGNVQGEWKIRRATVTDNSGTETVLPTRRDVDDDTGIVRLIDNYDIRSQVSTGDAQVTVVRRIAVERMPLFQFLAFYADDLEINPGPHMNLNGRVHSNADIYLTAGSGLDVSSHYLRMAGELHRHRKDSSSLPGGAVRIQNLQSDALVVLPDANDLQSQGIDSPTGVDSSFLGWDADGDGHHDGEDDLAPFTILAEEMFGGTLATGEHGVSEFAHPDLPTIQPFLELEGGGFASDGSGMSAVGEGDGTHAQSFFHQNAELVIVDDQVFDGEGNNITDDVPAGFLTTSSLYDAREGGMVEVVTVDLGRLGDQDGDPATYDPSPHYPANGLMYAYSNPDAGADESPNSFVFTNGAELNVPEVWDANNYAGSDGTPDGAYPFGDQQEMGLTIVSPQSVYVQGDYNTVNKKPASIIADTVNLLSNCWTGTKCVGELPGAAETTYNLAFVTGNQDTSTGSYNGGFENLPRFHENWSGVNCNITGAFVNLWRSAAAPGTWAYGGDRYTAPNRNWGFDTDFDEALPPFTPMVISARVVGWEVRN